MKNKVAFYFFVATLALIQECSAASPAAGDLPASYDIFLTRRMSLGIVQACNNIAIHQWSKEDFAKLCTYLNINTTEIKAGIKLQALPAQALSSVQAKINSIKAECDRLYNLCATAPGDVFKHEIDGWETLRRGFDDLTTVFSSMD